MILALLVFKLQLTSHPDGGHFVFCQYGVPMRRRLGAPQKSKQYNDIGDLWTKFAAFGRI